METEQTYTPLPVMDYLRHRIEGDRCGEISPDLRQDWERIKLLPNYPNNTDWAEVVAEWDSERFTTDLDTEIIRLRCIVAQHWNSWEYDECVECGAGAWVNPVGQCSNCDGSHTK